MYLFSEHKIRLRLLRKRYRRQGTFEKIRRLMLTSLTKIKIYKK